MQQNINDIDLLSRKGLNIDITHRCPLQCERCQRFTSFTSKGLKVPGEDISLERFEMILNHFNHINFCGQVSDPVHHPKFIEILSMIYNHRDEKTSAVHHASAAKPMSWYPKAFKANPNARWWFGIDGLPKDSHKYRTNQDGEKLFEIAKIAATILNQKPVWQYIVFSYNENDIKECHQMAKDIGADFTIINSSRWIGNDDPLKPKNPEYSLQLYDKD